MNGKEDKEPEIIELERVWYMEWYGAMIDISRDIDVNIRYSNMTRRLVVLLYLVLWMWCLRF